MFKKFFNFILIMSFAAANLSAQSTGKISGFVKSSTDNAPLENANIIVSGTNFGSATDRNGFFIIENIPSGSYRISASRIGYESKSVSEVIVRSGQTTSIDFSLVSKPIRFDQITVTATRHETDVTEVPVATDIISARKLASSSAQHVGELLTSIGSVTIKGTSDPGSLQTISLRGSTDSQVLVLFDGQRLTNSQNASFDFSTMPLEFVEKIEIVKGGHSALYGTNAVGGVINLISRSALIDKKLTLGIKSGIGSWNSQFHTINASQKFGKISYFTAFKHTQSDGEYRYRDHNGIVHPRKNNDLEKNEAFFKLNYDHSPAAHLKFSALYGKWERGLPGTITFPSTTTRLTETRNLYNLSYENQRKNWWFLTANAYYQSSNQNYRDTSPWTPENTNHNNRAIGFELQNRYLFNDGFSVIVGYDLRQDKFESTKYDERRRTIHGIYLLGEIKQNFSSVPFANKIVLIPSLRYDRYPNFDGQLSPKFGAVLSHTDQFTVSVRGNIGTSFRAPTFNDLYWPEDQWSAGNPDLKPENGLCYDAGFLLKYDRDDWLASLDFTYFVNDLENLNMWKELRPWFWMPQNVDRSLTRGTELQFKFSLFEERLSLRAAHTYLSVRYNNPNSSSYKNYLEYRPQHKVDLEASLRYSFVQMNIFYRFLDRSFKDEMNIQTIPRSNMIDANIGASVKALGLNLLWRFEVLNVLDKKFITFGDQPMPGRQLRISAGIQY